MAITAAADNDSSRSMRLGKRSLPLPEQRIALMSTPTLSVRQDSSSTSSGSSTQVSCGPKDNTGVCERPITSSSNTVPIVLGVVIPLGIAFCVLIYLHRRHVNKLKKEDAEDKTKSWDFGMDGVPVAARKGRGKKGGAAPEMSVAETIHQIKHDRGGISMDMGMSSPYLLPPELHQSRESLHSLSRSMTATGDDKYRATDFIPDDGSIRSPSSLKSHWDNSSTYTGSSRPRLDSESTKNLIRAPSKTDEVVPTLRKPLPVPKDSNQALTVPNSDVDARGSFASTNSSNGDAAALRASNNYLGSHINGGHHVEDRSVDDNQTHAVAELDSGSAVAKPEPALVKGTNVISDAAGFNFDIPSGVQELPDRSSRQSLPHELPTNQEPSLPQVSVTSPADRMASHPSQGGGRESSMYEENLATFSNHPNAYAWPAEKGSPPSHHPGVPPEIIEPYEDPRAQKSEGQHDYMDEYQDDYYQEPPPTTDAKGLHPNDRYSRGIQHRSHQSESNTRASGADYYDEDDSYDLADYQDVLGYDPRLLTMGMRPLPPDDPTENPEERANRIRSFYKEYFDEVVKPGGGDRMSYFDGREHADDYYGGTTHSSPYGSRGPSMMRPATQQQRHRAMSNGSYGPRAFSSASGRYGRPALRQKKKLPPPKALNVLPTPYKLKDDSMLPNPMDYAPPQIFKNQRSGTPDSLRGGLRPYSPSTRAFNPLVSSFDDLAALPSPHQLRKSSTFTSLDFAPPRFQVKDTMSDAGSIRSNRSGLSALTQQHIRAGAYRVSRIPKEVAGTRDELASALRPQWNMNR